MRIRLVGETSVLLPNRVYGDTDNYEHPHKVVRVTQNQFERFVSGDWRGNINYDFTVPVYKCHPTLSTIDDFEAWAILNNGKLITMELTDNLLETQCSFDGIITVEEVVEMKNHFNVSLRITRPH